MSEIVYRPFREADAADLKQIINDAFHIYRYVTGELLLDAAVELYLRERLLASSWTGGAVRDGHVVGVIMGQVAGRPFLGGRGKNRLIAGKKVFRASIAGLSQWNSIRQYFAFGPVYRKLRKKARSPLTDELTRFAVRSTMRGFGVGTQLYSDYVEHLRSLGRTDFYLYTDSFCSFGFYDKQGMTRASSEGLNLVLDRGSNRETLGVYLYAGTVD